MKSVSGRNWKESIVNKNLIEKLHQENNFSHILSKLIISRQDLACPPAPIISNLFFIKSF